MRHFLLLLLVHNILRTSLGFFNVRSTSPVVHKSIIYTTIDMEGNGDVHEDKEEPSLITREMFQRAMLEGDEEEHVQLKVKRKKRKKGSTYRILDNRDSLPFTVKVVTPDPYTKPAQKRREAKKNTKLNQEKSKKKVERNVDLINLVNGGSSFITASLLNKLDDGSLEKIVGEFHLDKNTNCGDIIEVGEKDFEVVKARCQYKYAGGQRFVMVRKVLEVKEVTRIAQENYLKRQFYNNTGEAIV